MQNVDFKAELRDPELARLVIPKLGGQLVATLNQSDTYFKVPDGRLKVRESDGEPTEWILYHRQDRPRPTISHFTIFSPEMIRERYGTRDLHPWVTVKKQRTIYMLEQAHIHLDNVEGLGWFIEVDALVTPRQHVGRCHELIGKLRDKLGPALGGAIATSYADMIALELDGAANPDPAQADSTTDSQ